MSFPPQGAPVADQPGPASRIDLLSILSHFTAEWRTGLLTAFLVFLVGTVVIFRIQSQFEATAVILPRDQPSTGGSSLAAILTGIRPNSNYVTLLRSRALVDDVIRRAGLKAYFHATSPDAARGRLVSMTRIYSADTVSILIRDRDPQLVARVANTYIVALRALQDSMATAQADLERRYFEKQLARERLALAAAEQDLEKTQLGTGLIQADTQTQIGLGAIANIRSQVTSLQVQLTSLLAGSTEQNPAVRSLRAQIDQLQAQERQMQTGRKTSGVGAATAAGRMPRINLEYNRRLREVRYHEALVNSLANHYESLRLASTASTDTFDVLDPAIPPEFPTWPPRQLFLSVLAGAALLVGILAIFLKLLTLRILADPRQRSYLRAIGRNFGWSR